MEDSFANFESVPIGENLELLSLIPGLGDDLKPLLESIRKSLENQALLQKKVNLIEKELEAMRHRNSELSLIIDGMTFRIEGLNKQNERLLRITEKLKTEDKIKTHVQRSKSPEVTILSIQRSQEETIPSNFGELEIMETGNLEVQLTNGQLVTYGKAELAFSDESWNLTTVSPLSKLERETRIYLVTNEEFDWNKGTIRVSCPQKDVEFDFSGLEDGYFTVKSAEEVNNLSFTFEAE